MITQGKKRIEKEKAVAQAHSMEVGKAETIDDLKIRVSALGGIVNHESYLEALPMNFDTPVPGCGTASLSSRHDYLWTLANMNEKNLVRALCLL
jgi:hypothetical protein